jgi:hypothetical protein
LILILSPVEGRPHSWPWFDEAHHEAGAVAPFRDDNLPLGITGTDVGSVPLR